MHDPVPRERYPWWVKFSLIGVSGRGGQWIFVWLSLASAVACIAYGLLNLDRTLGTFVLFIGGIGFPLAAAMYWLTIRWIDRHGTWS
jgi:hypothetical protein